MIQWNNVLKMSNVILNHCSSPTFIIFYHDETRSQAVQFLPVAQYNCYHAYQLL